MNQLIRGDNRQDTKKRTTPRYIFAPTDSAPWNDLRAQI